MTQGWKKEPYRHSLASHGIKSTLTTQRADLQAQMAELQRQMSETDKQLERLDLPEEVEEAISEELEDLAEERLEKIPLTPDEYDRIIEDMDIEEFTEAFYRGDYNSLMDDNPMVIEFVKKHFPVEYYKKETVEYFVSEKGSDIDETIDIGELEDMVNDLYGHEEETFFTRYVYPSTKYMIDDNPGIMDDLRSHWLRHRPYEEELREYALQNDLRDQSVANITQKDITETRAKVLTEFKVTEKQLKDIKEMRGE